MKATNNMRVLVADDDPVSRRILESMLPIWGYNVITTSDGNEAWGALQEKDAPPIVILDWNMPGINGVDVCRRARKHTNGLPLYIFLLTSRNKKKDIVAGLSAGADDYITKPFNSDELRTRVDVGRRIIELQAALVKRADTLQNALDHIKTLQGLLPICMHCHKIRNDQKSWERIENYIVEHSEAQLSHSICPECMAKYHQ